MINCDKTMTMISAYIDNELNDYDKLEIEKHLETCSNCKNELIELQQIISLIADYGNEDLPLGFGDNFHRKLLQVSETEKKVRSTNLIRNKYIRICSTIAAGLLVCILFKDYITGALFGVNKNASSLNSQNMVVSGDTSRNTESKESAVMDKKGASDEKNITAKSNTAENSTVLFDQATAAKSNEEASRYVAPENDKNSDTGLKRESSTGILNDTIIADSGITIKDNRNSSFNESQDLSKNEQPDVCISSALAKDSMAFSAIVKDQYNQNQDKQIKNISIKVSVDITVDSIAQIKGFASLNDAVIYEQYQATESTSLMRKQSGSGIEMKIINSNFNKFIEFINNTFGTSNISIGPMNIIDSSESIIKLNTQLNDLNIQIELLKKQRDYSKNELNQLLMERDELRIKLENTIMDTGYVLIDITFN